MRRATILLALLSVTACGYEMGHVAGGGRTISVPLFANETWRRDIERDVTRAVEQEIRTRTDYTLATGDADLLLEGKVVEIREGVLSEYEGAEIRESSVQIVAEITVTDRTTGAKIVDKQRISERKSFAPVKGETLRSAETAATRTLAERIVYALATGF